jgi:hypothetical protein
MQGKEFIVLYDVEDLSPKRDVEAYHPVYHLSVMLKVISPIRKVESLSPMRDVEDLSS